MRLRHLLLLHPVWLALLAGPTGCAYVEPAEEVETDPTEAKGPGLFTGREGAWTIYRGR